LSKSGQPFSNLKMDEHIARCKFGLNEAGVDVSLLGASAAGASAAPSVDVAAAPAAAAVATASGAAVDAVINDAVTAAAAAPPTAAAAASSAPSANPRSGTYVDGIRIPWWFHDARVHDSDAAVLHRKDPVHYKQFSAHSPRFPDYVWPRDINPLHPEQKEELDALAVEIAAEEAAKEQAKGAKKKKGKKRARASSTEDESSSQAAEQSDAADDAGVEDDSVDHATVQEGASHASPSRRSPRASASASVVNQSPLSSSATPKRRGRRAAAAALEEITDDIVNADVAQETTEEQARKRQRTADTEPRGAKATQTANKPRTRRELKL
jgi:hypothetical protein